MPEPEVGVTAAILNWNGGDMVTRCLHSLLKQTRKPEQRIVVDNASSDGSLERLQDQDPELEVIANRSNVGFARAANQAFGAARGRWLLLVNLDVEFEPDYLETLLAAGERDGDIGALTGKLLRPAKTGQTATVDSAGHILYRNGWAANRGEDRADCGQWERSEEVFGVTGAAALYRMRMLREVIDGPARPFDERFFAYIEDVDLDWRMRWLGWKAWYEPAVAWHRRGGTGARRTPFILRHILKNRLLLIANNDLWPGGLRRLPGVAALTLFTAVRFGLSSRSAPLGMVDFVRLAGASRPRRRFLRRRRRVRPAELEAWLQPFPYRAKIAQALGRATADGAKARP